MAAPRFKSPWRACHWPGSVSNGKTSLWSNGKNAGREAAKLQEKEGVKGIGRKRGMPFFAAKSLSSYTTYLPFLPPLPFPSVKPSLQGKSRELKHFPPTSNAPKPSPSCTPSLLQPPSSWSSSMPPPIACLPRSTPPMGSTSTPQARWRGTCLRTRYGFFLSFPSSVSPFIAFLTPPPFLPSPCPFLPPFLDIEHPPFRWPSRPRRPGGLLRSSHSRFDGQEWA